MRKYRIAKSDLGWNIYKKKEENGLTQMWFLDGHGRRTLNKDYARTFYHKVDAEGVLGVMKIRDGKSSD